MNGFGRKRPELFQLVRIGHVVCERLMTQEVEFVACFLQVRTDDLVGAHGCDTEGYQGWRHGNMFERAGHRVFASDGRQT